MILDSQAISAPEHPAFKKVLQIASRQSTFDGGDRNKFKAALMQKKEAATQALRSMLVGTNPAATSDIWTSDANVGITLRRRLKLLLPSF